MKPTLLFLTKQDHLEKKVTIFGIWFIALLLLLNTLRFKLLGKILIPHTLYSYEADIYLLVMLTISIGLIAGSNMMRRIALLILYLSMFFFMAEYIEESMRIFEGGGCIHVFKGYGIDYDSLIYPQKILKFMTILFLIPLIHMILIYILSNEESYKLYKASHTIRLKETLILFFLSITITIFFVISIIIQSHVPKTYPQKSIRPTAKPFKMHTYESLNLPKKPLLMYKVRFEDNATTR